MACQARSIVGVFDKVFFYSDSLNDLPLLEAVSHPVAVNPDAVLREHARTQRPGPFWTLLKMIRRIIEKVFGGSLGQSPRARAKTKGKWRVHAAGEHRIDRSHIRAPPFKLCEGLQAAGYDAYIVGGAVRDLLLGGTEDFDVATNATPSRCAACSAAHASSAAAFASCT